MDIPMFPKPKQRLRTTIKRMDIPRPWIVYDDPTSPDGERHVCTKTAAGKREYKDLTLRAWHDNGKICCICYKPVALDQLTAEHPEGRGMGGSRRDDRQIMPAHFFCNGLKGSVRASTLAKYQQREG